MARGFGGEVSGEPTAAALLLDLCRSGEYPWMGALLCLGENEVLYL